MPLLSESWLEVRKRRLGFMLTRPWLLWPIAVLFWGRIAFFNLVNSDRPDAAAILAGGRAFLHDPAHAYTNQAVFLGSHGALPLHGWLGPPAGLLLAAPFALLPSAGRLPVWVAADAAALLLTLWILFKLTRPAAWRRPLFVIVAGYFPPLFADLDAGQLGGFLLLLSVAGIWLYARGRTSWGGVLGGAAAAIKLYPAALLVGVRPRRLPAFVAGLGAAAVLVNLAGFLRLGSGSPAFYVTKVLLPSLRAPVTGDCAIDSPHTLVYRVLGGEPYAYIGSGGELIKVHLPIHAPALAAAATGALLLLIVVTAFWASARSGWHPVYGPSLGLALGALLPSEVNVYQKLPLLPLLLVVAMRSAERGRLAVLAALAVPLLAMVKQPCFLPFPDLWTLAVLAIFGICAWSHTLFAEP